MLPIRYTALMVVLIATLLPNSGWAQSGVNIQPTPDGGLHPRLFQDSNGAVHLLYFRKRSNIPRSTEGDLYYRQYDESSRDWGPAVRVSSQSYNYADPIYRANFAIDGNGSIHVVWFHPRPGEFFYSRSNPQRNAFDEQRRIVSDNLEGIDAGADIAAAGNMVAITWASGALVEEQSRTVYMRLSRDGGLSFDPEIMIGDRSLGACACCSLAAEFENQQNLLVAYRSAIEGTGRHMQLLSVNVDDTAQKPGEYLPLAALQKWELSACPVSTNDIGRDYEHNNWLVFESESRIVQLNISAGSAPQLVSEPLTRTRQKHPDIAFSSDDYKLIVWAEGISFTRGGSLNWQLFDALGNPVPAPGKPAIPAS